MTYKLVYTRSSYKDIKKLDRIKVKKLKAKIELYSSDPLKYAKKLSNSSLGKYRWRFGRYRVIFDIEGETIIILRVRHRKEVYKL